MIAYKLTCIPTGKIYIGITRYSLLRRVNQHFYLNNKTSKEMKRPLYDAISKYPRNNWTAEVVGTAGSYEELLQLERCLISSTKSNDPSIGYNRTTGGQGTLGFHFKKTPEQIEKSARFHRGRKRSMESRKNSSQAMIDWLKAHGRPRYEQTGNPARDADIARDYFSSPSLWATGKRFGIKAAATSQAMQRFRRRLQAALEAASPINANIILPRRIHPDWAELAA